MGTLLQKKNKKNVFDAKKAIVFVEIRYSTQGFEPEFTSYQYLTHWLVDYWSQIILISLKF